jgi:hypothetical protein
MTAVLGAYRVGSRHDCAISKPLRKPFSVMSEVNVRIAEAIPMYPKSVSIAELCHKFSLSHFAMLSHLMAIQERYLVAEDAGRLTRVKI